MQDYKKLSKTLLMATAASAFVMAAPVIPQVAEFTGQVAAAQELGTSSQASIDARAQARASRPKITSVQSVRERQGKILNKAQEYVSAEPPELARAKESLLSQRIDRWIEPELVGYYQILSSIAQSEGDMDTVLSHYKTLLQMEKIPYSLRDQLTYSVGQLEFSNGNTEEGKKFLYEWLQYQPNPNISHLEFFANIHYSLGQADGVTPPEAEKNFRLAVEYLNWAIRKAEAEGKPDKENWYGVLRSLHNSLEENDKVLEYAELLTTRWPKKEYWVQLSSLYAQAASEPGLSDEEIVRFEKKQLSAFEMAYRQDMFDAGREYEAMAQLYLYHESPYQSSKVMTSALEAGNSERNLKNLQLQANAFIDGKDLDKAVDPLIAAAAMSEDGDNYMRLANVYLNLDKYAEAAEAIDNALEKGGLRRPDQSSLLQGQAYLALEEFDNARGSFRAAIDAAEDDRTEKMARDMLRYVDSEEKRIKDIREYLS